jgi:hypothetical protein
MYEVIAGIFHSFGHAEQLTLGLAAGAGVSGFTANHTA